jgi:hypothetical protein
MAFSSYHCNIRISGMQGKNKTTNASLLPINEWLHEDNPLQAIGNFAKDQTQLYLF